MATVISIPLAAELRTVEHVYWYGQDLLFEGYSESDFWQGVYRSLVPCS